MRTRTVAVNILLPSCIAIATATTWFRATGDTTPSVPTVIGLALTAAGLAAGAEWLARAAVHAFRRRGRVARHRNTTV